MRQFSCIYNQYHCLSGVRETHGNKSRPVTGLVREAHPAGFFLRDREEGKVALKQNQ